MAQKLESENQLKKKRCEMQHSSIETILLQVPKQNPDSLKRGNMETNKSIQIFN